MITTPKPWRRPSPPGESRVWACSLCGEGLNRLELFQDWKDKDCLGVCKCPECWSINPLNKQARQKEGL